MRPVDYGDASSHEFVNLTCPPDLIGNVSASCPGTNSSVTVYCTGTYPNFDPLTGLQLSTSNTWSTQISCKVTVRPSCLLWDAATQAYDATSCTPVNWTATNTTCACGAEAASAAASESGGASFTSGSEALAGSFASMFDPASMLAALTNPSPLLMITFFTILALVLLNMVGGIRADMRDNVAAWTHVEVTKVRRHHHATKRLKAEDLETLRAETGVAETEEMRQSIEATRTVANYAESSLPDFVNDRSLCHTFGRAIVEEHEWVSASVWGAFDPIVPKYIRAQILGISLLWIMAGIAVCEQLKHPDLGCDTYVNEADCLVMTAPFDASVAACVWDPAVTPPCATAPPDTSSAFTPLNMAMLVAVLLCIDPFILVIEAIYLSVFNAPRPKSRSSLSAKQARVQQRWAWCVTRAFAAHTPAAIASRDACPCACARARSRAHARDRVRLRLSTQGGRGAAARGQQRRGGGGGADEERGRRARRGG